MTLYQIEKAKKQIAAIRKAKADEKRQWGGYHDGRGLRYEPPQYYIKLSDFKGAMAYFKWFQKNFPDDIGAPGFLFEWCITLFKNGKFKDAEKKVLETYMSNTYIIDKFLGRPFHNFNQLENSQWQKQIAMQYFPYSAQHNILLDFAHWLTQFVNSTQYQTFSKTFIDIQIALLTESEYEKRVELINKIRDLIDGI